jgi:hypothetical protein
LPSKEQEMFNSLTSGLGGDIDESFPSLTNVMGLETEKE